jgi:hypothetical protein
VATESDGRKWFRDVQVNVIANLIAAAIIYLGAVASGVLSADAWPFTLAMVISVSAIAADLWSRHSFRITRRAERAMRRVRRRMGMPMWWPTPS